MLDSVTKFEMTVQGAPCGVVVWYRPLALGGVLLHKRNAIGERNSLTS